MSTIVELITALVISFFGITAEEPTTAITEVVVFECCEYKTEPPSSIEISLVNHTVPKDDLVILNLIQKSIKIEHKKTENTLL